MNRSLVFLTGSVLLAASVAMGDSIWARSLHAPRALYSDDTARRAGDTLTVVIDERSVIDNQTDRSMDKSSSRKGTIKSNLDLLDAMNDATGKLFSLTDLDLDMKAETKFKGNADYGSDRKVKDQITVTVSDVLPNGNLVVVGSRDRYIAGDRQIVQISGIVRPSDITFSNTVQSDLVSDFKIVVKTVGQENRFTNPGWADRILNFLNPF